MEKNIHQYKQVPGGVIAPKGFKAAGVHCGIKRKRLDLAVIYSTTTAIGAGVFTVNKIKAAPLLVTMDNLSHQKARAIVVNAGNANSCTGEQGFKDAKEMVSLTASMLEIPENEVIVSSTGVIGVKMPMAKVRAGVKDAISQLSDTQESGDNAKQAIMTTDTFPKELAITLELSGTPVTLGAIAKGSGMIHPNMATMLGFITTDVAIEHAALQLAIKEANSQSFNMITVDGDTSTNDMAVIIANGLAGNEMLKLGSDDFKKFQAALNYLTVELAKLIATDGEGATKLLEVQVKNAKTLEDARKAALSVAKSSLVKTAIFGEDANWGRILCAVGYSGAEFSPDKVEISIGNSIESELMAIDGTGVEFSEEKAKKILENKLVTIYIDLKDGVANATAWGCDLSYDYVKINGSYRT